MSDNEEPSPKHFKLQSQKHEAEDAMEEGQEEWLSEDVLSDDEYYQAGERETSDYAIMSQEDTMTSAQDCAQGSVYHDTGDSNAQDGQHEDIEETLNNLENSQDKDFPDELGAFLIRKTDNKAIKKEDGKESEDSNKQTDDDGHDTDELLQMLGEDEAKRKKKPGIKLVKKETRDESTDDDDDFIFGSTKVTRVKVAKNFIKYPTKAEPEDMSDKEELSDEVATMKSMFVSRAPAARSSLSGINALQTVTKRVVSLDGNTNKRPMPSSHRQVILQQVGARAEHGHEEFLDEEDLEGGELETDDEEAGRQRAQRIMRPERMEEEVPSDADTVSDESLYDEIQTSESEDLDEWFTLDIRAERAGDYLPLLGTKAKQVLIKERNRVGARLATLDQSLLALRERARQQAALLRRAAAALGDVDTALRAV